MTPRPKTKRAAPAKCNPQKGYDEPVVSLTPSPHQRNRQRYPLHAASPTREGWLVTVIRWCEPPIRHLVGSRAEALALIARGTV
jgi:hypothetical protein